MPNPLVAVAGIGAGTSVVGGIAQSSAAKKAANRQISAEEAARAEQKELLAPFVAGGSDAFNALLNLAGVGEPGAQAAAIENIQQGPEMAAYLEAGENALLQNASATGGLRGGNTQAALAEFRPQLLAQMIDQQFGRLSGLSNLGQAAAAGEAASIGASAGRIGAAGAGAALAGGQGFNNAIGGIGQAAGGLLGQIEMPQGASVFGRWGFK